MNLSDDARRLWAAAVDLNRAAAAVSPCVAHLPPLLFFTDPIRTPRPWETAARLPPGAGVVYRHFGAPDAAETAILLQRSTQDAGVRLLIGLDDGLAEVIGADGVHLPQRALDRAAVLRAAHPDWILTGAVHEALDAPPALDAVVLSPVFTAGGASSRTQAMGLEAFRALADRLDRPAYALGGLNARNARTLTGSGACGLAAVGGIVSAFAA